MREFWLRFSRTFTILVIGSVVFLIGIVLRFSIKIRTFLEGIERDKLTFRDVSEVEEMEAGLVCHLECGHEIVLVIPDKMFCPSCTREIQDLKKMAGKS
jgi:hypothetical protein